MINYVALKQTSLRGRLIYINRFTHKIRSTEIVHPPDAINQYILSIFIKLPPFLFSVVGGI